VRLSWVTPQPEATANATEAVALAASAPPVTSPHVSLLQVSPPHVSSPQATLSSEDDEAAAQTEDHVFLTSVSTNSEPAKDLSEETVPAKAVPTKAIPKKRTREWGTSLLTAAVITVAVVLGWTVGRPSWQRVTGSVKKQPSMPAAAPVAGGSVEARITQPAPKIADSDAVEPADASTKPGSSPSPKNKPDDTAGDLVVYQNGKIIFRQAAPSGSPGSASANFRGTQPAPDTAEKVAAVFLSPQMASARLLQRIEPVYPESALRMHIQGEVELEALVGKDGSVEQLKLVSGDSQLAAASADAVRQWRFRPYQSDGKDVEFSTRLTVDFRLH
jgi:protein TonB